MAFGKFFDKFKGKKKPEQEETFLLPDEITLWDLKKGYMIDYEARTWEVKGVYQYDWGRTGKSTEYKLHDGAMGIYMHVDEQEGELILSMANKIKVSDLDDGQAVRNTIIQKDAPPKELVLQGVTYYMDEESEGYFRDLDERERFRFIEWHYEDTTEEKFISISRWSETELEFSAGIYAQDFEFSNILPR